MFYRNEGTWFEKTGIFDLETRKSLKRQFRNWMVMNLLLGNLGHIGAIRRLRKKAMKLGLRRIGSQIGLRIESAIGSRLLGRTQTGIGMNPALAVGAALGAGAGLMYLFDPDRGASRRATLKDGATHAINKTGSMTGAASRDLTNRARGIAARASSIFKSGATDDDTLAARVRSKMGRVISHPGAIEVTALNGLVRLNGAVLAREIDALLSCVRSTPGVQGLDNQLQIHSKAGDLPSLQGGRARRGARFELMRNNWAPAAKALSAIIGGALMGVCLRRRDALGVAAGTLGFGLMVRGFTNIETGHAPHDAAQPARDTSRDSDFMPRMTIH